MRDELANVSDALPSRPPQPSGQEEESPLSLADSSEGSTEIVTGRAEDSAAASAGTSGHFPEGGGSTGGFETVLGKLVVERSLVTAEEVELCNAQIRDGAAEQDPHTLTDLLIDNGFATRRQLMRLRGEFEEKKSTEQIPGYKIKRKLGSGAMATVYLARQLSLDRLVAIKILPKKFSANAKFIERFYKEGRAAAKLNHPNIVAAYDVGKASEHHYFVMEFVDGQTVHDAIVKGKRIDEKNAIQIVMQVAQALHHAHERGFIHRDIKPKNIIISRQGVVKLADLGLARALSDNEAAESEAGRAYGTPYYISPEQIRGEVKIGPPADIYGLGATFYHMVTGRVAFPGKNPSDVMHKHLKADLIPPDHVNAKLSAGAAQVIEMMMAKSRRDRYHNVDDLATDLKLIARGRPPHFAHRSLDLSDISNPAITSHPSGPAFSPTPRRRESPEARPATGEHNGLVIGLTVILVMCLVTITILVFMLTGR